VESIGEKLKSARTSRKLVLRDVAKDTNIAPSYIEALEDEEFDKFPSETYVIGFLKTYSEYLKLDADEIIHLYKGYKIGESATPIEELTKPTKSGMAVNLLSFYDNNRNIVFFVLVFVAALAVAWGIWSVAGSDVKIGGSESVDMIKKDYKEQQESKIKNIKSLQLSNDRGFILVYKEEAVQFLVDNKEVVFILKEIDKDHIMISFADSDKTLSLEMGKELSVELPDVSRNILFTLKGLTESRAKIMVALGKKTKEITEPVKETAGDVKPLKEGDNTSVIAQNRKSLKIIFEVRFLKKSFIEIYLDGAKKQRGFMPAGSTQRWEATEYIQVKIGNAGGVKALINGKDYILGGQNQVANKVITWKKDTRNPNLYHIDVRNW